ncbi:YgjV family protein [Paraferrimonas sp. SM1919]|uniref:YgjV family protein n=1 Tax=Paraferrimonas sp. SM1919 TaxID=2662263 RepID=UPI0013CFB854|nr:YgjV family protein [Paraferrimonas sp. SM1919]
MDSSVLLITGQAFGLLSFALGVASFSQKDDLKLKRLMLLLNISHSIHYLLLGAITSLTGALISCLRTYLSIHIQSKWLALVFVALALFLGAQYAQSSADWLPIMATAVGSIGLFCLTGVAMRLTFVIGAVLWLANNLVVGSVGGILLELSMIAANLWTIYRLTRMPINEEA